jgi:hypothetical protein
MRFLLSAVFWFTVVAAFMPRELAEERDAGRGLAVRTAVLDGQASALELCARRPEVCAAGAEAAQLAVDLGRHAVYSAHDALVSLEAQP